MAGGNGEARGTALERGDALLEHRRGRIANARVDVAERLKPEQRGGMIDVVEYERRRLIDRCCASAGGRIGLCAGVDGKRVEARIAFAIVHDEAALSRIACRALISGAREGVKARQFSGNSGLRRGRCVKIHCGNAAALNCGFLLWWVRARRRLEGSAD